MIVVRRRWAGAAAGAAALLAACGSSSSGGGGSGASGGTAAFQLTIRDSSFSPLELAVPPGATVTVVNEDAMPHSVTSEAAPGAFTPGAVGGVEFDTGAFTGQRTFTVPSNAAEGAVVPYYCSVHKGTMNTPNGTLRIDSSAQPSGAGGMSGGGSSGGGGGGGGGGGY